MQAWRGGTLPSQKARGTPGIGSKGHLVLGTRQGTQEGHTSKQESHS